MLKLKDEQKNIDKFYKNRLENHKEEANRKVWESLRWTLFWMRYKWRIGIGTIILLLGIGFWISGSLLNNTESQTKINTNDNITESILPTNYEAEETPNINTEGFLRVQDEIINDGEVINVEENSNLESNQVIIEKESVTVDQVGLISQNLSITVINEKLTLTGMISKGISNNIVVESDSSLLGYNRRTNLLPPGLRKQWFSVNVAVGPAFTQYNISGYDSEYLALRNSHESNKPGWSLGVDLRLHLKNWVISSGVAYSVYNQSRSYKHSFEEYSLKDSYYDYDTTWTWFFDPPEIGIPIVTVIDSNWVEVYKSKVIDNSGINQLKYIEIPIMIGYGYNANMFTLEIVAGVSAGFLVYSKIKVPDFANSDEIVKAQQMNQTMFNFVTNASFYFHINRRTSLFVSLYYKQNMVSVFGEDYPVNQRTQTYGLNLGINFRF